VAEEIRCGSLFQAAKQGGKNDAGVEGPVKTGGLVRGGSHRDGRSCYNDASGQRLVLNGGPGEHRPGSQALAFLPNERWVRAGDSIRWTFPTHERHDRSTDKIQAVIAK
jgi:plastocyanin